MASIAARTKVPAAMSFSDPVRSLYVHVPFCAHKCEYCAFYSETSKGEIVNRYVGALIRELELVADSLRPRTIFFGGGTPSLLNLAQWELILDTMDRLGLSGAGEWTVECNPATVSEDKARLLRSRGVNRISMGVQSLDEPLLDRLGRIHSRDMVFRSFDILRRAGFDNVNVDLMFAIPGQTMETWRSTLREATAMGSEHLSCYEVIYEEDTPLFEQLKAGQFDVNEELAAAMYDELIDFSASKGFHQYEIANFAQNPPSVSENDDLVFGDVPSRACRHNVTYWRGGQCHGLGPAASGYVAGARTKNWSNTTLYCEQLEKGKRAIESTETLSPSGRAGELAAFGLRMTAGWPLELFRNTTGFDLATEWREPIARLVDLGYAELTPERFKLTRQGLRYADWAAELFLRI
jgi:oxygen-independent coproporphyrinogen-3 oxidase